MSTRTGKKKKRRHDAEEEEEEEGGMVRVEVFPMVTGPSVPGHLIG